MGSSPAAVAALRSTARVDISLLLVADLAGHKDVVGDRGSGFDGGGGSNGDGGSHDDVMRGGRESWICREGRIGQGYLRGAESE